MKKMYYIHQFINLVIYNKHVKDFLHFCKCFLTILVSSCDRNSGRKLELEKILKFGQVILYVAAASIVNFFLLSKKCIPLECVEHTGQIS